MFIKALSFIAATPVPYVWFIGDMSYDTKCARDAGCTSIRFYHKEKPIDCNADLFINGHYHL